ncbi:MAG: GGDEF domain-containing protein [Campylobacterota bacterium]|nr:GGDEF domain-containing protein [Campylobacterota bacterium]
MSDIKDLVKKTLFSLKKNSLEITPDNYFKEFYRLSKNSNLEIKECILFDDLLKRASLDYDKSIKTYGELSSRILEKDEDSLKQLISNLSDILSPSVDFNLKAEIDDFVFTLSREPQKVFERETFQNMKKITQARIKKDRDFLVKKTKDIHKLTTFLSKYFEATIISSGNSSETLSHIKNELKELDISEASAREMGVLQTKLIDTVCSLEDVVEDHRTTISNQQNNVNELEEKLKQLQNELAQAQYEKSIDYLTQVLNRRAFDTELEKIEKKHKVFDTKYAIVFYDIDHFKRINDNYGHDCGDAILRTFAAVLKNLTRQEDTVARYGGEEFVVILNYTNEKELVQYIKRVKKLIDSSEFNYGRISIELTFSAGVAYRRNSNNCEEMLKKADDLLYKAKSEGRDRIILEDGVVI